MKKITFILLASVVWGRIEEVPAQSPVKDAITVEGLIVGNHYSEQQIIEALGQPTKADLPSEDDVYLNAYTYHYGKDRVYRIDGELYGFDLRTSKFLINGLIKVGDNISKVDLLGGIKKVKDLGDTRLVEWRPAEGDLYDWLSVCFYYDENDVIVFAVAFINDL